MRSRLIQFRYVAIRVRGQEDVGGGEEERKRKKEKKKNVRLCRLRAQGDNQETKEEK